MKNALFWLKTNDLYYRDIVIDAATLETLPYDGDMSQLFVDLNEDPGDQRADIPIAQSSNIIESSGVPNLPAFDVSQIILDNLRRTSSYGDHTDEDEWPDLDPTPVNKFSSEGYICKAFPVLFPYGKGDLHEPRLHKMN